MTSAVILLICILFSISKAADFLITSNPQSLVIFNQYEQPLTEADRKSFLPYCPLEIVNKKELLGDQITEALRINYQGIVYYLLKDDKGEISGKNTQQYNKTLLKCTLLNDTVEVGKKIFISEKQSSSGVTFPLTKGEHVIRVFSYGSQFYILKPGKTPHYGWYSGSPTVFSTLKKTVKKPINKVKITDIEHRVKSRLQTTNETYSNMFGYFNQVTRQQKSIPEWIFSSDGKSITCTLNGSKTLIEQMEQSTRYVVQDIEQMLLGEPFTITYKTGIISINPDYN